VHLLGFHQIHPVFLPRKAVFQRCFFLFQCCKTNLRCCFSFFGAANLLCSAGKYISLAAKSSGYAAKGFKQAVEFIKSGLLRLKSPDFTDNRGFSIYFREIRVICGYNK